jgi:mono/diheme cytochrome c family protein
MVTVLTLPSWCTSASADQIDEGRTYFMRYCASCHGVEANGKGFVARALTRRPPDLRHLGRHLRDRLLGERIARYIDGREVVPAHGEREMPVWGERFEDPSAKGAAREGQVSERINAIVAYVLAIQEPAPPRPRKSDSAPQDRPRQ